MSSLNRRSVQIVLCLIYIFRYVLCMHKINPDICTHNNTNNLYYFTNIRLINLTDFQFTLQPQFCHCEPEERDVLGILLVVSHVGHTKLRSDHRTALSQTALKKLNLTRVFLLAEIPESQNNMTQESIEDEHWEFNDIVQGNFDDLYNQLSYKTIMGLLWATFHRCLRPAFIVKVDDDIIVDYFRLSEVLSSKESERIESEKRNSHLLAGYIWHNMHVVRNPSSKYFVSLDYSPNDYYPPYVSGGMYMTVPITARTTVMTALKWPDKFFWLEDVYVNGILREINNIPMDDFLSPLYTFSEEVLNCCIREIVLYKTKCPYIIFLEGSTKMVKLYLETFNKHCLLGSNDMRYNVCTERKKDFPSLKKMCLIKDP